MQLNLMRIRFTRASVAMSDDADAPHYFERNVPYNASLLEIIEAVCQSNYLAPIAGGKATWVAMSRIPVAVMAQQWAKPKMLTPVPQLFSLDYSDNVLSVHFDYRVQQNPDSVYEEFQRVHSRHPYR